MHCSPREVVKGGKKVLALLEIKALSKSTSLTNPPYSVLAWRIPGTGEPGGLPSVGSHRVGHN